MMKVLIVGFSVQNAGVLNLLINRYHPECRTVVIERTFSDDLRLRLPVLSMADKTADAMIISLDGVGMMSFDLKYVNELQQFIGVRPAVFTVKSGIDVWRKAEILPKEFALFLNSPLTKDDVIITLEQLFELVPQVEDHRHRFGVTKAYDNPQDEEVIDEAEGDFDDKKAFVADRGDVLHDIVRSHFKIADSALLHGMLDIILHKGALKLTMGSQTLYVDGAKNLALVANIERLVDYCTVVNSFKSETNTFIMQPIGDELFHKVATTKASGYTKYALNTLLWQVYSYILPQTIDINDHHLLLKVRYMPNFMNMNDVPEYVRHIVSSCVVSPRSLNELMADVGHTHNISKSVINRVFLLAILSGTADFNILRNSFNYGNNIETTAQQASNDGVQKAKKTGFLKRFLGKLTGKS